MGMENREDTGKSAVNTDFLTEKIKKRPVNRRRLLRQLAVTAALAAVFGAVACISFIILMPRISSILYPEEPIESVELPEELPSEEMSPQDMVTDASERQEMQQEIQQELQQSVTANVTANVTQSVTESLTEKMNAMVADAISASAPGKSDLELYSNMYVALKKTAVEAGRSMVTVTGAADSSGWLDSYETRNETAGLITSLTDSRVYVFCAGSTLEGAERITITFPAGDSGETETVGAQTAGVDTVSGYLLLQADSRELSSGTLSYIQAYRPGTTRGTSLAGEPVIAIGAPTGENGSICYGALTGNGGQIDMADADYRRLTTDIYTAGNASGVLVDTEGRVLGLIDMSFNEEELSNRLCAVDISGLLSTIDRLLENRTKPYLGVHGTDIVIRDIILTEEEEERDGEAETETWEKGVYIRNLDVDSPAMFAGLRSADVIVAIDGKEVTSLEDLSTVLWDWDWDGPLEITVLRHDAGGLRQITAEAEPVSLSDYLDMREEQ